MPRPAPEPPPSRLVVVRHGATDWSSQGRHTGRTDLHLDEAGKHQARKLGERLTGHNFDRVLSSPLGRARQTCALAGYEGREEICEDLAEWNYGDYEGMTTAQIRAHRPGWSLWRDGVLGGESLDEVSSRVDQVIALVRGTEGDTLAFAHGHVLRVLCARWLDLRPSDGAHFALEPAGMGVLGWEREVPVVLRWNIRSGDPFPEL